MESSAFPAGLRVHVGVAPPALDLEFTPGAAHFVAVHDGPAIDVRVRAERMFSGRIEPGTVNVIPAGHVARWTWSAPCRSIRLHLPTAITAEVARELALDPAAPVPLAIGLRDPVISALVQALAAGPAGGDPLYLAQAARFLAAQLLRVHGQPRTRRLAAAPRGVLTSAALDRLREEIRRDLAARLDLAALARRVHLSPSRFAHAFRALAGESPHRFVMRLRTEEAIRRLAHGQAAGEVALVCGFADQGHLARHVRRATGRTPRALTAA
jgi:AraC family transcriptional regulator